MTAPSLTNSITPVPPGYAHAMSVGRRSCPAPGRDAPSRDAIRRRTWLGAGRPQDGRGRSNPSHLGRERHTIGTARHDQRNDARPFDVELLRRRGRRGGDPAVEKQPVGRDVRPVPARSRRTMAICATSSARPIPRRGRTCTAGLSSKPRTCGSHSLSWSPDLRYNSAFSGGDCNGTCTPGGRPCAARRTVGVVGFSGHAANDQASPTNDAPNPYQSIEGWAKLPEGRTWGSTSAVEVDKDGKSIWVAERCGHELVSRSHVRQDVGPADDSEVRCNRQAGEELRRGHADFPARHSRRS